MNNYLIPANTKKGQLILGIFRKSDLILFISGVMATIIMLAFMPLSSTWVTIGILSPAVICAFLVMPIPYYHNMLTVIVDLYDFVTTNHVYKWKGWCRGDESNRKKRG